MKTTINLYIEIISYNVSLSRDSKIIPRTVVVEVEKSTRHAAHKQYKKHRIDPRRLWRDIVGVVGCGGDVGVVVVVVATLAQQLQKNFIFQNFVFSLISSCLLGGL